MTPDVAKALIEAQKVLDNVAKDSDNPHFKSKYVSLAAVRDVVYPAFNEAGFSIMQYAVTLENGGLQVVTKLTHESGEEIVFEGPAVTLAKSDAQGVGSAITYLRRYNLLAIAGIAPEDDDGNSASDTDKKGDIKGTAAGRNVSAKRAPEPTPEEKITAFLKRESLALPDKMNDGDFCMKMREAAHHAPDVPTLDRLVKDNAKRIDSLDGSNTEALRATIENAREQITSMENIAA